MQGARTPPPPPPRDDLRFSNTTGILRKKTMWFIGIEVELETSASPPKENPGSAPDNDVTCKLSLLCTPRNRLVNVFE